MNLTKIYFQDLALLTRASPVMNHAMCTGVTHGADACTICRRGATLA
jgi:hypothetical protein